MKKKNPEKPLIESVFMGHREYIPLVKTLLKEETDRLFPEGLPAGVVYPYTAMRKMDSIAKANPMFIPGILWEDTKNVFEIDETLFEDLSNTDVVSVQVADLVNPQYPLIYMRVPTISIRNQNGDHLDATEVAVHFDYVRRTDTVWLKALMFGPMVMSGEKEQFAANLIVLALQDGLTVQQCIDKSLREIRTLFSLQSANGEDMTGTVAQGKDALRVYNCILSLLTYLNSSIAEMKKATKVYPSQRPKPGTKSKKLAYDRTEVGVYYGQTVRAARTTHLRASSSGSGKGGIGIAKRPHIRRGHWHHYWTGRRSDSKNRKYIAKWLPPIVVHGEREAGVRINRVK